MALFSLTVKRPLAKRTAKFEKKSRYKKKKKKKIQKSLCRILRHTMMGTDSSPGIISLSVQRIFELMELYSAQRDFLIRVSYLELYNEVCSDLIVAGAANGAAKQAPQLRILEDAARGIVVHGLSEEIVTSAEQLMQIVAVGQERRHVAATNMNDQSSRSHTMLRILIESRERRSAVASGAAAGAAAAASRKQSEDGTPVRVSQLNLVDLAGSERVALTGAAGDRLREGGHINKSLLTLGNVIEKLADACEKGNVAAHVPYRDSKLTRILQTALGGNARSAIICTITPAVCHVEETLSTLKFANRAKRIRNQPMVNELLDDKAMLRRCQREIEELRRRLEEGNVEVAEARIRTLTDAVDRTEAERDSALTDLQAIQDERLDKLRRLVAFVNEPTAADVPGAAHSGRHAAPRARRDSFGGFALDDDADDDADAAADADGPLVRPHDGETIDLGAVARAANLKADAVLAGVVEADAVPHRREPDLQLSLLPHAVANEIVALRVQLVRMEDEREQFQRNVAKRVTVADEAARAAKSAAETALRDATSAFGARDEARRELAALRAQHGDLQQKLQSAALQAAQASEAECDKLRAHAATVADEREAARAQARDLQRTVKASERAASDAQRELEHVRERFAKLELEQAALAEQCGAARERATVAEHDTKHAQRRAAELEAALADAEQARASSGATLEAMAQFEARYEALSRRCQEARSSAQSEAELHAQAEWRCDALESELVAAHQQCAAIELDRDELRAQLSARDAELARLRPLPAQLAERERAAQAASERHASELSSVRKAAGQDAQQHAGTVELLEAELDVQRNAAQTLTRQLTEAMALMEESEQRWQSLTNELQEQLTHTRARETALGDELRRAQADVAKSQKECISIGASRDSKARDIVKLQHELAAAQAETTRGAERATHERERADAAERRITDLRSEMNEVAMRVQLGEGQSATAQRLRERCDKLSSELAAARDQVDAAEQRSATAAARAIAEKQELEMRCVTLQQSVTLLEEQARDLGGQLAQSLGTATADAIAGNELTQLQALNERLTRQAGELKRERDAALASAAKASVAPPSSTSDTGSARIAELETQLHDERERRQRVQAKLKEVLARMPARTPLSNRTNANEEVK
jgi:centromeric protein E